MLCERKHSLMMPDRFTMELRRAMGGDVFMASELPSTQKLIDAAISVVATKGLHSLTYRSVAVEAGVAHGLIRHHFGSLSILLEEALTVVTSRVLEQNALNNGDSPDIFERSIDLSSDQERKDHAFISEMLLESRRDPSLKVLVSQLYEQFHQSVRDSLRQRGIRASRGLVILLFAALDGLVIEEQALDTERDAHLALQELRKILQLLADKER